MKEEYREWMEQVCEVMTDSEWDGGPLEIPSHFGLGTQQRMREFVAHCRAVWANGARGQDFRVLVREIGRRKSLAMPEWMPQDDIVVALLKRMTEAQNLVTLIRTEIGEAQKRITEAQNQIRDVEAQLREHRRSGAIPDRLLEYLDGVKGRAKSLSRQDKVEREQRRQAEINRRGYAKWLRFQRGEVPTAHLTEEDLDFDV